MDERDPLDLALRSGLATVPVDAPADDGLAAVRDRYARRRGRQRLAAGALVAVAIVAVVVAVRPNEADDPQGLVTEPATTTTAPAPSGVVLDPAGPYLDGQEVLVELRGLDAADEANDRPRLCATVEGTETCDPLVELTFGSSLLRRLTFTASGWRDCADAAVDCRIVVIGSDGRPHRSERLEFTGAPTPREVELTVTAPDGGDLITDGAVLQARGLEVDPSWTELGGAAGSDLSPFVVQVCSFEGLGHGCDILRIDQGIDPADTAAPTNVPLRREIFSWDGWRDCVREACFVVVRVTYISSVNPDGSTSGADRPVTAALLRFDPTVPAPPRPSIQLAETGPFAPGDEVTVHIAGLPTTSTETFSLAICHQDPTVLNDCGYLTMEDTARDQSVQITMPSAPWPEHCRRDGCFLAVMPGQEGAGPVAQVPLDLRG